MSEDRWEKDIQNKWSAIARYDKASNRRKRAEESKRFTQQDVQTIAEDLSHRLWKKASTAVIPDNNPYGHAATGRFPRILSEALAHQHELNPADVVHLVNLGDVPTVNNLMTPAFVEKTVRERIAKYTEVAADPKLLVKERKNEKGDRESLVVQHRASGLRAKFTLVEPGLGRIAAKAYQIPSIDESTSRSAEEELEFASDAVRFAGLGIGFRIYQKAHELWPDVRWKSSGPNKYSGALRAKLHASDPYIWHSRCDWCKAKLEPGGSIQIWEHVDKEFFSGHVTH